MAALEWPREFSPLAVRDAWLDLQVHAAFAWAMAFALAGLA